MNGHPNSDADSLRCIRRLSAQDDHHHEYADRVCYIADHRARTNLDLFVAARQAQNPMRWFIAVAAFYACLAMSAGQADGNTGLAAAPVSADNTASILQPVNGAASTSPTQQYTDAFASPTTGKHCMSGS